MALNVVFEGIVEKDINYKSKKMCVCADDTVLIARNLTAMKEVWLASEHKGRRTWIRQN
jgi:frataxin-like iron-binding protein CyaY